MIAVGTATVLAMTAKPGRETLPPTTGHCNVALGIVKTNCVALLIAVVVHIPLMTVGKTPTRAIRWPATKSAGVDIVVVHRPALGTCADATPIELAGADGRTPDAPPPPARTALTKQPPAGGFHCEPVADGAMKQGTHGVPVATVACVVAPTG